jgi:hypothetical protein
MEDNGKENSLKKFILLQFSTLKNFFLEPVKNLPNSSKFYFNGKFSEN